MKIIMLQDEITSKYGRLYKNKVVDIDESTAKHLIDFGLAELVAEPKKLATEEPKHIGGGWYEMPDGEKVHGRKAAYGGKENK